LRLLAVVSLFAVGGGSGSIYRRLVTMACDGRGGTEGSALSRAEARLRTGPGPRALSASRLPSRGRDRCRVCNSAAVHHTPQESPLASTFSAGFVGNRAKLNRQTQEVEHLVTHGEQTTAISSNRQKIQFCKTKNLSTAGVCVEALIGFLTGSNSRTEIAVTRSKQSPATILIGSRIDVFSIGPERRHASSRSQHGRFTMP
jgi:hypothetical protein